MRRLLLGGTVLTMLSATAIAEPPKWGPWVEFGGQVGTNRTLGQGNLFAPLWQSPNALLFADVRGMIDDLDALEANLGLGFGIQILESSAMVSDNYISTSGITNAGAIHLYDATVLPGSDGNTVVGGPPCFFDGPSFDRRGELHECTGLRLVRLKRDDS